MNDHTTTGRTVRGSSRWRAGLVVVTALLALNAVACSSDAKSGASASSSSSTVEVGRATTDATFHVRPGIGVIAVQGADPGSTLVASTDDGTEAARGVVDRYGSLYLRDLKQGGTFTVRGQQGKAVAGSKPVKTLVFGQNPPQSFYDHLPTIKDGFQYLKTRDGTTLAITVRAPIGKTWDQGPFPTLINMSGYDDANPNATPPMSLISSALGFATVSVNERGTGCSGGVAGLFDQIWAADGYDVVEAVAAQPWSLKVGLTGISFPGITQLFAASTNPPHLAAATPMSVLADAYRTPGYPGGIFNNGFTESWLTDRRNDAKPAPEGGQGYAIDRVKDGDKTCLANQKLRLQTQDPIAITSTNPYRDPKLIDERSPINYVSKIKAPLLLSGAWQDEQVGADFANLFPELPRRDDVKVVAANGVHSSPLEPELVTQWYAFVSIYVADKVPDYAGLKAIMATVAEEAQGGDTEVPPFPTANPYAKDKTLAQAKATYLALPRYRVVLDSGGDPAKPGLPGGGFVTGFDTWPPKEAIHTRMYLGADGALTTAKPTATYASDRYFPTIDARPMQTIPGQGQSESWVLLPDYDWRPLVPDTAVGYVTKPLTSDTTMAGPGSFDLWIKSSAKEADLQVGVTEVRADGKETYVQDGWLRASHRKLDPKRSTDLNPWPTHLESDASPLPIGQWVKVRVALAPAAHVFRKGSQIRITIAAPGGDRTRWSFRSAPPAADARIWVSRSASHPSSVLLPLTTAIKATDKTPACPGLRGQPCRTYEPETNGG